MMSSFSNELLLELYDVIVKNPCQIFTGLRNGQFIHKNNYQTITLDMVTDEISRRGIKFSKGQTKDVHGASKPRYDDAQCTPHLRMIVEAKEQNERC